MLDFNSFLFSSNFGLSTFLNLYFVSFIRLSRLLKIFLVALLAVMFLKSRSSLSNYSSKFVFILVIVRAPENPTLPTVVSFIFTGSRSESSITLISLFLISDAQRLIFLVLPPAFSTFLAKILASLLWVSSNFNWDALFYFGSFGNLGFLTPWGANERAWLIIAFTASCLLRPSKNCTPFLFWGELLKLAALSLLKKLRFSVRVNCLEEKFVVIVWVAEWPNYLF